MYNVDKDFVEPYDMLYYYSPSVPYDFPKERVPQNLCEKELILMSKCILNFHKQSEDVKRARYCHKYASELNQCKRRRDMRIWAEIKSWEDERVQNLKPELRQVYLNSLKEELHELKSEFEKVTATDENANKRWRLNADILQTQWRVSNIDTLLQNLY